MNTSKSEDAAKDRLYKIVRDGMCVGCGLCASLAGPERVRMKFAANGDLRPHVVSSVTQEIVDRIYDVCPSTRLDSLPRSEQGNGTIIDPIWGPYKRMVSAHATDPATRMKAATGGVITALAKMLVETGRVEFVLQATPSAEHPLAGVAQFSRSEADVGRATGSIYGPVSVLARIHEALDVGVPFAFVGKPCDIAALRNVARFDARVNDLVKYWLTPVCGGYVPPTRMAAFFEEKQVDPQQITTFKYRGDGCPGDTEWKQRSGASGTASMMDLYGGDGETTWELPHRCKLCPDGPGESADISAGDQWVDDFPDPEHAEIDPGSNATIVRTHAGLELFEAACAEGYLTFEHEITPEFYDTCQHHHVSKKRHMRARWDALAAHGSTVPRSTGLRLDAMRQRETEESYQAQFEGTVKRLKSGNHIEEDPQGKG